MLIDVYNKLGQVIGQTELIDEIFAIEPNEHVMHQAVVTYLANQRQGTKKTKIRSEVSGGGKKPGKQKGMGGARVGSTRSPLYPGGGTIHGPKPINYRINLPVKIKKLARKSALSARVREDNLIVVEDFSLPTIKTKEFVAFLHALKLEKNNVLILLPNADMNLYMSARNIPKINVNIADKVSAYDILRHSKIVLFKGALETIVKHLVN